MIRRHTQHARTTGVCSSTHSTHRLDRTQDSVSQLSRCQQQVFWLNSDLDTVANMRPTKTSSIHHQCTKSSTNTVVHLQHYLNPDFRNARLGNNNNNSKTLVQLIRRWTSWQPIRCSWSVRAAPLFSRDTGRRTKQQQQQQRSSWRLI